MRRGAPAAPLLAPVAPVALAALAALAAACGACSRERMDTDMADQTQVVLQRQCFGRFCIDVPAAARRAGAEYGMRWMKVREELLAGPDAKAQKAAADAAWAQAVGAAMELEAEERLEPGDVRGKQRANQELEPGLRFLSYYTTIEPIGAKVVGLRAQGPVGLWLEATLDVDFEAKCRTDLVQVARGFAVRPEGAKWPEPAKDWFYLDHSALQLPFHEQEAASATFDGEGLDGVLEVEVESVREVKKKGLVEKFMESVGLAGDYAQGVTPVRSRSRKVNGFEGEELVLRSAEQGELAYLWSFPGEANSGDRPRIRIAWQTGDENPKAKGALWDQMLDSLKAAKAP